MQSIMNEYALIINAKIELYEQEYNKTPSYLSLVQMLISVKRFSTVGAAKEYIESYTLLRVANDLPQLAVAYNMGKFMFVANEHYNYQLCNFLFQITQANTIPISKVKEALEVSYINDTYPSDSQPNHEYVNDIDVVRQLLAISLASRSYLDMERRIERVVYTNDLAEASFLLANYAFQYGNPLYKVITSVPNYDTTKLEHSDLEIAKYLWRVLLTDALAYHSQGGEASLSELRHYLEVVLRKR